MMGGFEGEEKRGNVFLRGFVLGFRMDLEIVLYVIKK